MGEHTEDEAMDIDPADLAFDPGAIYADLFSGQLNILDIGPLADSSLNTYESQLPDATDPIWRSNPSPPDRSSTLPTTSARSCHFVPLSATPQFSYEENNLPILDHFGEESTLDPTILATENLEPVINLDDFMESQFNSTPQLETLMSSLLPRATPIEHLSEFELPVHSPALHEVGEKTDIGIETPFSRITRKTFDPAQVSILNTWLEGHLDDPYPSREEKQEFMEKTSLDRKQIDTWFCNVRKRHPALSSHLSPSVSNGSESSLQYDDRGRGSEYSPSSWRESSCDSVQTTFSTISECLLYGASKRGRKRRYSTGVSAVLHSKRSKALSSGAPGEKQYPRFQCTLCGINLSSKSWKRHEETKHLPQVVWTCMATGPVIETIDAVTGQLKRTCGFCFDDVERDCLRLHRIQECLSRPSEQRTFFRKEHLRQHFRNFHPAAKLNDEVAERWKSRPSYSSWVWQCGFCGETLTDWNARARHISRHFLDGLTMESWCDMRPEESTSTAPNVQADSHVDELVRNGVAFRCPPKDDEIVPHTHCFHRERYDILLDSEYFSGCESIRLGLSQPIEDNFIQCHIWTCSNGLDLILSALGMSGATYWFRCPIQIISATRSPSLSGTQALIQLQLDRPPEAFAQTSDGDPILAIELAWASMNRRFNLLLKFNSSANLEEMLTFLFTRMSDQSYIPRPPNIGDHKEPLPQCHLPERPYPNIGDTWNPNSVDSPEQIIQEASRVDENEFHVDNHPATPDFANDFKSDPDSDPTISAEEIRDYDLAGERSTTHQQQGSGRSAQLSEPQTPLHAHCLQRYTCGYPRYRHKHWGCRQKFRGLIGIADHLRSKQGKSCKRKLLRLQEHFDLSCEAPLHEYGLPQALFEIYPALAGINFDNLAKLDDPDGDDEDELGMSSRALSTIFSVSSRSISSCAKSVVRVEN